MKKTKTKKIIYYWFPVGAWALLIFMFSSMPTGYSSEIQWKDFIVKKSAHLVEFATLAVLLFRLLINSGMEKRKAGYWAVLLSVFYAVTDEVHQIFTPGRDPTVRDVAIDTAGAVFGVYFAGKILPERKKKKAFKYIYNFIYPKKNKIKEKGR